MTEYKTEQKECEFMGKWDFEITGMNELIRAFDKMPKVAEKAAADGLYKGAGKVADSLSREIGNIKTEKFKYAKKGKKRKPSPQEKAAVANAPHGIAKFKNTGTNIETSIGLKGAGYATIQTEKGPVTKPVAMIANSINHGTSFMGKQPFLRKALKQNQTAAIALIEEEIQKQLNDIDV